jgi:protein-S-isoprenylcysteine O-methyltransferase Ste14
LALALMFAVPHSLLLWPPVRSALTSWIPSAFYGLFYTAVTCVSLLALFAFWQGSPTVLWELTGTTRMLMDIGFYASWIALFYSLYLTGLGYQTGLTPWLYWVRRENLPRREFCPCGAYRWLRHPVYLSFMGLVWFTPHMSLDHVVLTGVWTTYLLIGSYLKDRRLTYFLGDDYREYQARVPGFPLMPFGPLARRPLQAKATASTERQSQIAA